MAASNMSLPPQDQTIRTTNNEPESVKNKNSLGERHAIDGVHYKD